METMFTLTARLGRVNSALKYTIVERTLRLCFLLQASNNDLLQSENFWMGTACLWLPGSPHQLCCPLWACLVCIKFAGGGTAALVPGTHLLWNDNIQNMQGPLGTSPGSALRAARPVFPVTLVITSGFRCFRNIQIFPWRHPTFSVKMQPSLRTVNAMQHSTLWNHPSEDNVRHAWHRQKRLRGPSYVETLMPLICPVKKE